MDDTIELIYARKTSTNIERIDLVNIKKKSITSKNVAKKAFEKGEITGLKKGFVRGSIASIAIASAVAIGYKGITALNHNYPRNPSFDAAYESYQENDHVTSDHNHYWVDFMEVANSYDPETMDLDSYLYGVFCSLCDVGEETRLEDMDILVHYMYRSNKTEYDSFVSYCNSRGLCIEENGELIIDIEKYKKAIKEYMQDVRVNLETEQNIEEFKEGRSV